MNTIMEEQIENCTKKGGGMMVLEATRRNEDELECTSLPQSSMFERMSSLLVMTQKIRCTREYQVFTDGMSRMFED